MEIWLKNTCQIIFFAILFFGNFIVSAYPLNMKVENSRVNLQADGVPLLQILQDLSYKTGLTFNSFDSIMDPVSARLENVTVEECLQRLLRNKNYVLMFKGAGEGEFIIAELKVFEGNKGGSAQRSLGGPSSPPENAAAVKSSEVSKKTYSFTRSLLSKIFDRSDVLAKLISQEKDGKAAMEGIEGLQLSRISRNSFFSRIDLNSGDVVLDVNGMPVRTVDDFIGSLHAASATQDVITIGRLTRDREQRPIEIRLH